MIMKGGKTCLILCLIILSGFFCIQKAQAEQPVFISEICWMGSEESASDEWLELYNNTSENINLSGWTIRSIDGQPEIVLEGIIPSQGYFLLERSDDESVPEVVADMIYSGSLGNNGETLELYDDDDNLIDVVDASLGWLAGENESKYTMQLSNWEWVSGEGTPKAENYKSQVIDDEFEEEENEEILNVGEVDSGKEKKIKIIINEIYPNPVGSDREKEFIELYNAGNTTVDLEGWKIEVGNRAYEFGKFDIIYGTQMGKSIGPGKHFVIFRNQSGLVLKNSGGELKLYKPGKKTVEDSLKYSSAPEGYTYVNTEYIDLEKISTSTYEFFLNSSLVGEFIWSAQISPGSNNQVKALNTAPQAIFSAPEEAELKKEIFFDASDTIDEEGDDLEFVWDFGDGVRVESEEVSHVFLNPGNYEVKLKVNDGAEESVFSQLIKIKGEEDVYENNILDEYINEPSAWYEDIDISSFVFKPEEVKAEHLYIIDAKKQGRGDVKIEGVVSAIPGIIGTQYFYIMDDTGGIRVYNYRKEFPKLKEGNFVQIEGEIVELRGETTLKTSGILNIEVLDSEKELTVQKISSEDIVEENVGNLVEIEGIVSKKDMPRLYINDGLGEVTIYIKQGLGIETREIKENEELKIYGILGIISGEIVLAPRRGSDLEIIKLDKKEVKGINEYNEDSVKEWDLPARDTKNELLKYFIVAMVLGVVILIIYFYKKKKS